LVKELRRSRHRAKGTALSPGIAPNELWCADYKGEFKLGNSPYCYPLTVTDHASRYLLLCEALESIREDQAITAFERLFRESGLPQPFDPIMASRLPARTACSIFPNSPFGGCDSASPSNASGPAGPQQNGRHERMHLTLKKDATHPPGMNCLQQ
jgi:transposase InsO family protein